MPSFVRLSVISLLLVGSLIGGPMPWKEMRIGMSAEEIVSLLGDPVFRRQGRGFQTWTYDHGAEVLLCGLVVGWTTPSSPATLARHEDVWIDRPPGEYLTPIRMVLCQYGGKKRPPTPAAKPVREIPRDNSGMGYEEYLQTLGRNKG